MVQGLVVQGGVFRLLAHFNPMFYFYTHLKTSENLRFSDFSEGIEMEH